MFDLHYKNRATLHRIITEATEPVNSGKEPLSHYLCHSIHVADSKDNWSFNFKHPGFPKEHKRTFGVGQVKLPGGAVYRQKEILMFFYIMQFTRMYPDGDLYNRRSERVGTFNAVWNEEYFKKNTRGKKTTYGSKQAMTHTTQTKQTLTSQSKTGYATRKNENPVTTQPVKTHQEHPGNKHLITSYNNSRETEHLKDRKKQVQVKKVNTVNRTQAKKKNGKKKRKKSTLKKREGSLIHDVIKKKKKKLTEEVTDVNNKKREEEINVTVGQNQRETWMNLFASVSKHLKTCNEGTEIKPMKFKVLN